MARYSLNLARTASLSLSLGSWSSSATVRRTKLIELTVGQTAAPADNTVQYVLQRFTAAGTNTAVVPQPLDPADAAALTVGGVNHTVEPTYTANQILLTIPMNQRATFRWVAPPGGELLTPAVSANGIGIATPVAGGLPAIAGTPIIEEQ